MEKWEIRLRSDSRASVRLKWRQMNFSWQIMRSYGCFFEYLIDAEHMFSEWKRYQMIRTAISLCRPNMVLARNKCIMGFVNCPQRNVQQGSCLRKLLRMCEVWERTGKRGPEEVGGCSVFLPTPVVRIPDSTGAGRGAWSSRPLGLPSARVWNASHGI